jgi:hypothetical protein
VVLVWFDLGGVRRLARERRRAPSAAHSQPTLGRHDAVSVNRLHQYQKFVFVRERRVGGQVEVGARMGAMIATGRVDYSPVSPFTCAHYSFANRAQRTRVVD